MLVPDIAKGSSFAWDSQGEAYFFGGAAGGNGIVPAPGVDPFYLLGILNSSATEQYLHATGTHFRGDYLNCEIRFIRDIPIPIIAVDNKVAARLAGQVTDLAKQLVRVSISAGEDGQTLRAQREFEGLSKLLSKLVGALFEAAGADLVT